MCLQLFSFLILGEYLFSFYIYNIPFILYYSSIIESITLKSTKREIWQSILVDNVKESTQSKI